MTQLIDQLSTLIESAASEPLQLLVENIDPQQIVDVRTASRAALACRRLNDMPRASKFSVRAMQLQPDNLDLLLIHTGDLIKLGKLDQAAALINALPDSVRLSPRMQLQACKILYQRKEFTAVQKILEGILRDFPALPSAHMELAHVLLMQGEWQRGWEEYQWRYRLTGQKDAMPKFRMPPWDGRNNLDHILLIADQGYGDSFQFSRYIPLVAQRCAKITLMRSEPLALLMDSMPEITQGVSSWANTPLTDAYCTLSDLPRIFSTRPNSIPAVSTQPQPSSNDLLRWREKIHSLHNGTALRVGVVWTGRTEFESNYLRAVPPELMATLGDVEGVQLFSLQVGMTAAQAQKLEMADLAPGFSDFADTAAAIKSLDLVITTDTSVAHLAGTLGAPTWVLLSYAPDWRWGHSGNTSDWYHNVRLFRQDSSRSWQPVIDACKQALLTSVTQTSRTEKS